MQALAGGADSSDDEDGLSGAGRSPTYVQEQEALRRGFLEVRHWLQNRKVVVLRIPCCTKAVGLSAPRPIRCNLPPDVRSCIYSMRGSTCQRCEDLL